MIPRVGFLGTGWIGRHRMQAVLDSGVAQAAAICDPSDECVAEAQAIAGDAVAVGSYEAMLAMDLDGIVIATPSAQHAEQSIQALRAGAAVFSQKPLGRNAAEALKVVEAARLADRLLGVDLSYRHTRAMMAIVDLVQSGVLGRIFAVDLTFHNAYGPDKPWFYDRTLSGGGCVIDLGVHLVDLALWALGFPEVGDVRATLRSGGSPLDPGAVEDYATAQFSAGGTDIRLACSWRLNAGQDAVIEAAFYGTEGGAALRNVGGSFFDFTADRFRGTTTTRLIDPPDDWGGGAAVAWARRLAVSRDFDPQAEQFVRLAGVLDDIYASAAPAVADPALRLVRP
jgi:predicted dehydrogenase